MTFLAACGLFAWGCGGTTATNGPVDASSDAATNANAPPCSTVLASDYDQSCTVDTDCVAVGEVPSCPALACDGCTSKAINKSVMAQYMTAFDHAFASRSAGACGCGCESGAVCRSGRCQAASCAPPPADALPTSATCATDADCGSGDICGFPELSGCSVVGTCFPKTGAICKAVEVACACDGTSINIACNGLPSAYAPKPFAHSGVCGLDAGSSIPSDASAVDSSADEAGPVDAGNLMDGAACVSSSGSPCGAGLACCPTAGYFGAPTACTPTCTGSSCAGSCRALP